jgi:hypothetical protein
VPEKETTGSTVPRRQLGRHLRELRSRQRITVHAAAEKLEWSEALDELDVHPFITRRPRGTVQA